MPPYVRFSQSLRPLVRATRLRQHIFHQKETYRRISTLPCFTLDNKVCVVTGYTSHPLARTSSPTDHKIDLTSVHPKV
jgi:hypothetical protein